LSIFAEKLGAASIVAIDHDEWCIENANENIVENGCKKIKILKETDCSKIKVKADILLANINLNIIKENLKFLKSFCKVGSTLLFSGILCSDVENFKNILFQYSIKIDEISEKDNWALIRSTL
jgi:ribosomal protein L11 methyltransferase